MKQPTWLRWRPLTHPPRRLWVQCSVCHYATVNKDRSLAGWQETFTAPRRYRCDACAEGAP